MIRLVNICVITEKDQSIRIGLFCYTFYINYKKVLVEHHKGYKVCTICIIL